MEVNDTVELNSSNELAVLLWDYVHDQVNVIQHKILSVKIEAIIAVLKLFEIPKWRYKEIIQKIRLMSKFYHLKIDISKEMGSFEY